jgi:hypothetical protein
LVGVVWLAWKNSEDPVQLKKEVIVRTYDAEFKSTHYFIHRDINGIPCVQLQYANGGTTICGDWSLQKDF